MGLYTTARKNAGIHENLVPLDDSTEKQDDNFTESDLESLWDSPSSSPVVNIQRIELFRVMRDGLPPQYWKVISMSLRGYTSEETASQLGVENATIRTRLFRARDQLRQDPRIADYRGGYAA